MKRLFFILTVFTLSFYGLYAQDATVATVPVATEDATTTSAEEEGSSETATPLDALQDFAPTFEILIGTDTTKLNKRFDVLEERVAELGTDYLFRVQFKVEKLLSEYTNLNKVDTNDSRFDTIFYYDIVSNVLSNDKNIALALNQIRSAIKEYDYLTTYAAVIGRPEEFKQLSYDINLYAGIFYMYKGEYLNSSKYFSLILADELTEDSSKLVMVNRYIAGINNILAQKQDSVFLKSYFYNVVFDRLWDIVTLNTEEGDDRNNKYAVLIDKYHTIVFPETERFKLLYSEHFDRLGVVYADTEDEIVSREQIIQPEAGPTATDADDADNEAATTTTTTDGDTTEDVATTDETVTQ